MPYIGWQIAFFNQNCNNALAYQWKVKLITKKVKTKLSKHFGSFDMRFNNFVQIHIDKKSQANLLTIPMACLPQNDILLSSNF